MFRTNRRRGKPELRQVMHERVVAGMDRMSDAQQELVVEAAEHNPDPITRREAIEQELMEMGRSQDGERIGD